MKVIQVEDNLEKTFKKLQILKRINKANYKTKIKYNEYLLPAGSYKSFEAFMTCLGVINNYYESNEENTIKHIRKTIFEKLNGMTYDEKIETLYSWDKYYKALKKDNTDLFNREIILDLHFGDKFKLK